MVRPPVTVELDDRFCANHVVDLTAGCSFGCLYCPFAAIGARRRGASRPTLMDLSALRDLPSPPSVFLSPASDAFAPQAAESTHSLLGHLLRQGTVVGIVTKGVIPERTIALLTEHRDQVEGVVIGVTNLDDRRNRLLEPGCPPARERLENLDRLGRSSLPSALRIDPIFPTLDDAPSALATLVCEAARRGAQAVTATYVFAWGRTLRRLRREPVLAAACRLLTERAPMEGGNALSVPLARKIETYTLLANLAAERNLWFNTCGCKDLRIRETGMFIASCRNVPFLCERGLAPTQSGVRLARVAGGHAALPSGRRP